MSRIAVVGATGPTGQLVVTEALNRGHDVVTYVRRPSALVPRPRLTVIGGQLDDEEAFANAIRGCEVVVCALGARSLRERRFMAQYLSLVTAAMKRAGVNRLVLTSALGSGAIPRRARGLHRIIFTLLAHTVFSDRTKSEDALSASGIAWDAVYPPFLSDESAIEIGTCDLEVVDPAHIYQGRIPRANVAQVLVCLAERAEKTRRRIAFEKTKV